MIKILAIIFDPHDQNSCNQMWPSPLIAAITTACIGSSNKYFDRLKVDLKNTKKTSRSSSFEEQIFDVSILTKSCSYKKEKVQKYKLFAALIGTHGKTDWKEINANLQGKFIYIIRVCFKW